MIDIIAGKTTFNGSIIRSVIGSIAKLDNGQEINLMFIEAHKLNVDKRDLPKRNLRKTIKMINDFLGKKVCELKDNHQYSFDFISSKEAVVSHFFADTKTIYKFNPMDFKVISVN